MPCWAGPLQPGHLLSHQHVGSQAVLLLMAPVWEMPLLPIHPIKFIQSQSPVSGLGATHVCVVTSISGRAILFQSLLSFPNVKAMFLVLVE